MRKKTSHTWYALLLLTDYSKQNYKHHVKNEDKIDESHKSQLKFEYEIYLLNYTIKIKTYIGFLRFFRFFKNLGFLKPTSTALRQPLNSLVLRPPIGPN